MRLLLNTRNVNELYHLVTVIAKSCKSDGFSDRFKKEKLSSVKQGFYFWILRLIIWGCF